MKNSQLKKTKKIEDNIIKYVINLFRIKTEENNTAIKDVRNLFRLRK